MSKQHRQTASTDSTARTASHTDALSRLIDQFEALSTPKALGICLVLALAMIAYIYNDFLFGNAVLLYTDIGSDAVNIYYPLWYQQAKLWAEHGALHGYSLETVMGMPTTINLWDPFQWIVISGGPEAIPERVAIAEIVKSILIACFGFGTFRLMGLRNLVSTIGALCLSFCGWVAIGAGAWHVFSTQVLLITIALWSAEYTINQHRLWYVVAPLFFAFITQIGSYLTLYLTAAIVVYCIVRSIPQWDAIDALRRTGNMILAMVIGVLISYSALAETLATITQSGRAEALETVEGGTLSINKDKPITALVDRTELTNVIQRTYSTNSLGVGDRFRGMSNYLEAPLLYYGLPVLLFFPLYGIGRSRREKITWGVMLCIVIVMLLFPWFRYAFWAFKLDYFREFTMLIGAFLLLLAMRGLNGVVTAQSKSHRYWVATSLLAMLLLPFVFAKPANLIDVSQRTVSVSLLLAMGGATLAYLLTQRQAFLVGLLALTMVDLSINADATINNRSLLAEADIRNGKLYGDATHQALDWIREQDGGLYRVVKYNPSGPAIHASINDAMVQGFNGLIGYSSFHSKYYLKFMSELGCVNLNDPNEAKWVSRVITRPFLAAALGSKYFITKGGPFGFLPEIFPLVQNIQGLYIHRSDVALPVIVAHDRFVTPEQFRALEQGKMDKMLFDAVVLSPEDASLAGVEPFDFSADTLQVLPIDFVNSAQRRRSMMKVETKTTASGLTAEVDLNSPAFVVLSVPYNPNMAVIVDDAAVKTFVANFGLVGFKVGRGKHRITMDAN